MSSSSQTDNIGFQSLALFPFISNSALHTFRHKYFSVRATAVIWSELNVCRLLLGKFSKYAQKLSFSECAQWQRSEWFLIFFFFCTIRYQPSSRENSNTDNTKMKKLNDNYNTNSVYNGLFMA